MRKKTSGWLVLLGAVGLGWAFWKFRKETGQTSITQDQPEPTKATILLEFDEKNGCRLADFAVRPDPLYVQQRQEVSWTVQPKAGDEKCEGLDVRVLRFRYLGPLLEGEFADLARAARATTAVEETGPFELSDESRAYVRLGGTIVDRVREDATPGRYKYDLELSRNRDPIQVVDPEVRVRPWP